MSGGCSAEFLVRDEHPGRGGNGYGSNGYDDNRGVPNAGYQAPPPPPPSQPMTIPAGTQIQVQLRERIAPDSTAAGQMVSASLASNLVVNGVTVAPAGARVELKVVGDDPGRQYPLSVKLEHLDAMGESYHFETNAIHNANESVAGQNQQANGSVIGNALGSFLDAGAARVLSAGSVYSFHLTEDASPRPPPGR